MRNLSDFLINTSEGSNIKFYLTTCISVNATKQERSYGVEEDGFFLEVACACAYEWNACLQCPRRRPLL